MVERLELVQRIEETRSQSYLLFIPISVIEVVCLKRSYFTRVGPYRESSRGPYNVCEL